MAKKAPIAKMPLRTRTQVLLALRGTIISYCINLPHNARVGIKAFQNAVAERRVIFALNNFAETAYKAEVILDYFEGTAKVIEADKDSVDVIKLLTDFRNSLNDELLDGSLLRGQSSPLVSAQNLWKAAFLGAWVKEIDKHLKQYVETQDMSDEAFDAIWN